MLLDPNLKMTLQQGDIIQDVPFVIFPKTFNVKANDIQGQSKLTCEDHNSLEKVKEFSKGNSLAATQLPLILQPGMIVTQGCDIDFRDSVTLARVYPLAQLIQEVKEATDHSEPLVVYEVIRRLTEGHEYPHLVYVGSPDGRSRFAADLLRVQSFQQDWKSFFKMKRWKTLTPAGLAYVQARLSFHAGRLATEKGFWHCLPEDNSSAEAITPDALEQAKARLFEKMNSAKA